MGEPIKRVHLGARARAQNTFTEAITFANDQIFKATVFPLIIPPF